MERDTWEFGSDVPVEDCSLMALTICTTKANFNEKVKVVLAIRECDWHYQPVLTEQNTNWYLYGLDDLSSGRHSGRRVGLLWWPFSHFPSIFMGFSYPNTLLVIHHQSPRCLRLNLFKKWARVGETYASPSFKKGKVKAINFPNVTFRESVPNASFSPPASLIKSKAKVTNTTSADSDGNEVRIPGKEHSKFG